MGYKTLTAHYIKELKAEVRASRACIERVPSSLYQYRPHEKSMVMGYLLLLVADMPRWLSYMVEKGEIDFATYPMQEASNPEALVALFDNNIRDAVQGLENMTEEAANREFKLMNNGQLLFAQNTMAAISETINHWVHHRGQLTVYMRLNDIAVPSIYGPSADEKKF